MNVDLPAPFGPSRPVTPGGTDTLTSLRPMTCPYHFETCSAVTMAVVLTALGAAGTALAVVTTGLVRLRPGLGPALMSPPPRRGRAVRAPTPTGRRDR